MKLKSILLVMLALCLTVCLCACGGDSDSTKKDDQPTTAATEATTTTEAVPSATQPVNGKANYTIKVVDASGAPIEGAMVQMCDDTSCLIPMRTGADGVAVYENQDVFNYSVKFATVPAGYILPVGADGMPAPFYFAENTYEMTLVLESAN